VVSDPKTNPTGGRLAALRNRLGLKQREVEERSVELERSDPNLYQKVLRTSLANQERDGVGDRETMRATLAEVYGLDVDTFRAYLFAEIDLEEAMAARGKRARGETGPPRSGIAEPGGAPRLRTHPEWADLCARAIGYDPQIKPETLKALGEKPFLYGPIESFDLPLLVDLARGYQSWKKRSP
jgi:transcriptional regulator with XRE-family HTH domain